MIINETLLLGYRSRTFNVYERQIEEDWARDDKDGVSDLIDGWVRTVASESDFNESKIDQIVEKIVAHMLGRRESGISPFAAVDEIRLLMIEKGLNP
ncbi:MAG: hypothetical protein Q8R25_00020 [bacterium]|nr:hypothetical protein [bacterium]